MEPLGFVALAAMVAVILGLFWIRKQRDQRTEWARLGGRHEYQGTMSGAYFSARDVTIGASETYSGWVGVWVGEDGVGLRMGAGSNSFLPPLLLRWDAMSSVRVGRTMGQDVLLTLDAASDDTVVTIYGADIGAAVADAAPPSLLIVS